MKCVIFCGGKGTRLREETEFKPKPLVEIGGRPILWHIMKIYDHYGIKEFILPLGYKGDMIKRYFMEYRWRDYNFTLDLSANKLVFHCDDCEINDWKITFVETGQENGTASRLYQVKQYLEGEEDFCLTYGDGVSNINISDLINFHNTHKKMITITGIHPHSKYGQLVTNSSNEIIKFSEKPVLKDYINGGFMMINKKIFDSLTSEKSTMIETILQKLSDERKVMMYKFEGFWHSLDTYKDFEDLNLIWEENKIWKIW